MKKPAAGKNSTPHFNKKKAPQGSAGLFDFWLICRARSLQYSREPPRAIKPANAPLRGCLTARLDSAGPPLQFRPRRALRWLVVSLVSLWGCFLCCLLLLAPVRSPFASSSAVPASARRSSAGALPAPLALASCGVSAPLVVGGSLAVPSRSPRSCLGSAGAASLGSACVGSLAVRASSPSCAPVPVLGRASCRRCSSLARCRRLSSSALSCLRLCRFARSLFFSLAKGLRGAIWGLRLWGRAATRGDGRSPALSFLQR